jgi:hypothetical protein
MALETKLKEKRKEKEKENLPVQPVAWRSARAGLLFSISRIGPSHFFLSPLLFCARVGRPRSRSDRTLSSLLR